MFFRRKTPHQWTFEERIASLKELGFESQRKSPTEVRVTRGGCGAMVEWVDGGPKIGKVGVLIGEEIGMLVNRGYQMFLRTPSGREIPALATHLEKLHAFEEDLREGLWMTSLYNLSLGTTTDEHLYDRVEDRDEGPRAQPWDKER